VPSPPLWNAHQLGDGARVREGRITPLNDPVAFAFAFVNDPVAVVFVVVFAFAFVLAVVVVVVFAVGPRPLRNARPS